jgi:hypothetical protein
LNTFIWNPPGFDLAITATDHGLKPKRLQTLKSDLFAALAATAPRRIIRMAKIELTLEWATLRDALPDDHSRHGLSKPVPGMTDKNWSVVRGFDDVLTKTKLLTTPKNAFECAGHGSGYSSVKPNVMAEADAGIDATQLGGSEDDLLRPAAFVFRKKRRPSGSFLRRNA